MKASFHYRRDSHTEWNENHRNATGGAAGCTVNVVCFKEPHQTSVEDVWSAALENTIHVTSEVDLVQGFGYDWRHLIEAEDFTNNAFVKYPLKNGDALSLQGAAIWSYSPSLLGVIKARA